MTMPYNSLLLETCTPQIYSGNLFRLLGSSVDVPNRGLRRRADDLKAAAALNELEEEYSASLRPPSLPSSEEITRASSLIQDPQRRFIEEFFWYWPLEWGRAESEAPLRSLATGDVTAARDAWEATVTKNEGVASLVARHNLAVLAHSRALDLEHQLLSQKSSAPGKGSELSREWDAAVEHWEYLQQSEAFWSHVLQRALDASEARLSRDFVQQFRVTLPVAFDNINAVLAASFARAGQLERVKAQVEIMRRTNAGEDDITASLRRVTEPLHTRIELAVQKATEDLPSNKKHGAARAQELQHGTGEPLAVLAAVLGTNNQEYGEACDQVAGTMLVCQVAYGNETNDWATSLTVLESARKVARGASVKERINDNLKTVRGNIELSRCWYCKTREAVPASEYGVHLHRVVHLKELGQKFIDGTDPDLVEAVRGLSEADRNSAMSAILMGGDPTITRAGTIKVPRCAECASMHAQAGWLVFAAFAIALTAGIWVAVTLWDEGAAFGAGVAALVLAVMVSIKAEKARAASANSRIQGDVREFPLIKELLQRKWTIGKPQTQ